jgi:hypothetical protein
MIDYIFLEHPHKSKMTYLQHLCFTINLSFYFLLAGAQSLIHSVIPCLFENSTTDTQQILEMFILSHDE